MFLNKTSLNPVLLTIFFFVDLLFMYKMVIFFYFSGSDVSHMGNTIVHSSSKSPVGVQREQVHLNGDIQRIPAFGFSQRIDVSNSIYVYQCRIYLCMVNKFNNAIKICIKFNGTRTRSFYA